ncbi:MAG TPA: GDP-mannose 4,6-dehydratase [Vicinamibacterales bacterium]|nr:GDP-mannose 4,6-dehydratase [Vicinamibacterales bacterium]
MHRPVIVTGAAGFAGSHLADRLARKLPPDQPLVAWHRPGGTLPRTCAPRVTWAAVDLLDREAVAAAIAGTQPTAVYHCAGSPHVASSWSDSLVPLESNVLGTHHLLLAVERHAPDARVLVPSSALVYAPADCALAEEAPLLPRTPYGLSKLAQELLAARAHGDRDLRTLIARPFNHIGPRQRDSFVASAFARQIAEAEAGLGEPVVRVGNLEARRDLTDVRDTVRAYQAIVERGATGRTYNVCSGRAYRVGELLERLIAMARVPMRVAVDAARLRPADIPLLAGDPSRIERELGWRAEIPIEETLADLLAHWRTEVRGREERA